MLYLTVWSGSRFGLKIDYVWDCVILLRSGWPSQIPDGKGVNVKKSGSGDQTYLRTENERGTAGDETKISHTLELRAQVQPGSEAIKLPYSYSA